MYTGSAWGRAGGQGQSITASAEHTFQFLPLLHPAAASNSGGDMTSFPLATMLRCWQHSPSCSRPVSCLQMTFTSRGTCGCRPMIRQDALLGAATLLGSCSAYQQHYPRSLVGAGQGDGDLANVSRGRLRVMIAVDRWWTLWMQFWYVQNRKQSRCCRLQVLQTEAAGGCPPGAATSGDHQSASSHMVNSLPTACLQTGRSSQGGSSSVSPLGSH